MTAAEAMHREGRRQGFRKGRAAGVREGRRDARVEAVDELLGAGFGWPVIESAIGIDAPTYRGHKRGSAAANGKAKLADAPREEPSAAAPERTLRDVFESVTEELRQEGRIEGYRDGRQKGRIEGRRAGRLEAAEGLLQAGLHWPVIESATGIDVEAYRGQARRATSNASEPKPEPADPHRTPARDGAASPSFRTTSLRERLLGAAPDARQLRTYRRYGVLDNPFPSVGHRAGPPRLEDAADAAVADRFRRFERCGYVSQAIMIEGAPGVGKATLLDHYEEQFRDYCRGRGAYYVIRYQPAPSVGWLAHTILRSIVPLEKIGRTLARRSKAANHAVKECAQSPEVRTLLNRLAQAAESDARLAECARLARAWIVGRPITKRHRAALGVSSRLYQLTGRMQALRDVVYVSERLRLLDGVVLLIDELEKPDYSLGRMQVLRFLVPMIALIEALPERLFLMVAMTPQARERYFTFLSETEHLLQDSISLSPIMYPREADRLFEFYVSRAREAAQSSPMVAGEDPGTSEMFGAAEVKSMFRRMRDRSEERGIEGVTPRDFLHTLHGEWESRIIPDKPDNVRG